MSSNLSAKNLEQGSWKRVPTLVWRERLIRGATRKCEILVKAGVAKTGITAIYTHLACRGIYMDKIHK